jgi:hypothetical protein
MDSKFRQLIELGAGDFEHVESPLIEHLERTRCLLKSWAASELLQDAGLYYAAYNASDSGCSEEHRADVARIIGRDVEQLIFRNFACNRAVFHAQCDSEDVPRFCSRFTHKPEIISRESIQLLCELTAAIQLDKFIHHLSLERLQRSELSNMFKHIERFLSAAAIRNIRQNIFHSNSGDE